MLMLPSALLRNKPERMHLSRDPLHRPEARRLGMAMSGRSRRD